ncbi:MAG: DNA repair protein RecO [Spirochaetales bacterium]|nr:DNA repair protein RecO [Spirochaetales bacterium]
MQRNQVTKGIILSINRVGEIHKGVTFLSPELGLVSAIAHGAWKTKSRLRATTQLFGYSEIFLYHDPVRKNNKITDMRPIALFPGLSRDMEKYYTACTCVEVILKSHGGGESVRDIFSLLLSTLTWLDKEGAEGIGYIFIQFLFRFLSLAGYTPDLSSCSSCGKGIPEETAVFYHPGHPVFFCGECRGQNARVLNPGMKKYLLRTKKLVWPRAIGIKMEKESVKVLKEILINMTESLIERPLKSINLNEDNSK